MDGSHEMEQFYNFWSLLLKMYFFEIATFFVT